jgi:hypothetical protein
MEPGTCANEYVRTSIGQFCCTVRRNAQTRVSRPIRVVPAGGAFEWGEGNIGGVDAGEVTLTYGQSYHFKGWTVDPSLDGTRFTNDASGHGMFVSIDRVSSF